MLILERPAVNIILGKLFTSRAGVQKRKDGDYAAGGAETLQPVLILDLVPLMLNPSTLIGCIYQILNCERGESQRITAKKLANCPPATSAKLRAEISLKWES